MPYRASKRPDHGRGGTPLAAALGAELARRRIAAGKSQEDVAKASRSIGLGWSDAIVGLLENGQRGLDAEELVLFPVLVGLALGVQHAPRSVGDLLGDTEADVCGYAMDGEVLDLFLAKSRFAEIEVDVAELLGPSAAERKAARKLATLPEIVAGAAINEWGRPLDEERDARVREKLDVNDLAEIEPTRLARVRGHVTRELVEHLRTVPGVVIDLDNLFGPPLDSPEQIAEFFAKQDRKPTKPRRKK
jgi:hypothetical protein